MSQFITTYCNDQNELLSEMPTITQSEIISSPPRNKKLKIEKFSPSLEKVDEILGDFNQLMSDIDSRYSQSAKNSNATPSQTMTGGRKLSKTKKPRKLTRKKSKSKSSRKATKSKATTKKKTTKKTTKKKNTKKREKKSTGRKTTQDKKRKTSRRRKRSKK